MRRCVVIAGDRTFTRIGSLVVMLGWGCQLDALRTAMFLYIYDVQRGLEMLYWRVTLTFD